MKKHLTSQVPYIHEIKQNSIHSIYTLLEKYRPILDACYFEFNKDFVGNYVMYDDIYEEFKYSFFNLKHAYDGHDVYDDPLIYAVNEPVREQGYPAFDLFLNYETALIPLGTAMFIKAGLINAPMPDISSLKKIKNKIK